MFVKGISKKKKNTLKQLKNHDNGDSSIDKF